MAGRFVSRDPLGLWGDPAQLGNGQSYCGANPVNRVDPLGLWGQRGPVGSPMEYGPSGPPGATISDYLLETQGLLADPYSPGTFVDWDDFRRWQAAKIKQLRAGLIAAHNAYVEPVPFELLHELAFIETATGVTGVAIAVFTLLDIGFGSRIAGMLGGAARGGARTAGAGSAVRAAGRGGEVAGVADDAVRAAGGLADDAVRAGPRFGPDDLAYGPSAGGRLREFADSGGGRILNDVVPPGFPGGKDAWIRLSTETIEDVVGSGGKIHFDLSNVQCLDDILSGVGEFANSVTGHELRYLRDHWERLSEGVKFYRGGREVAAPW